MMPPAISGSSFVAARHREDQHDDDNQREHQHDRHGGAQPAIGALDADTPVRLA
jgi:hypothetical protein